MENKITVDYKDHDKVILTDEVGNTYTSKSEELMDFLHRVNKNFVLADVSGRSELLLDFVRWQNRCSNWVTVSENMVDDYLAWKKSSCRVQKSDDR